jgi:hypothetical protein
MKALMDKVVAWFKANKTVGIIIILVVIFVFFGRQVKKLFGTRRIRHRRYKAIKTTVRRIRRAAIPRKMRKSLPRSVGVRSSGKGYPAAGGGYIPFKYNKDGTVKKAWQVGGTLAAKHRMSRLRKAK